METEIDQEDSSFSSTTETNGKNSNLFALCCKNTNILKMFDFALKATNLTDLMFMFFGL